MTTNKKFSLGNSLTVYESFAIRRKSENLSSINQTLSNKAFWNAINFATIFKIMKNYQEPLFRKLH